MFKQMECVSMYTPDLTRTLAFYAAMGLTECYRDERRSEAGNPWTLVGMRFPDGGSDLFFHDNADQPVLEPEVEIVVDDVQETFRQLAERFTDVRWIREPFRAGLGHVAVVQVPGETVIVLVGK